MCTNGVILLKKYKTELHTHTAETSNCGHTKAKDLIEAYIAKGYSTVVISDHLSTHTYFKYDYNNMTWDEKIDIFVKGYNAALQAANGRINVLFGMEMRFDEDLPEHDLNDYLVFGITEEFLRNNGDLINMNIESFSALAHKNGLLIFQAHPFRKDMTRADPKLLDGAEIYNGCPRHESHNDKAEKWAKENCLKGTSGSDFHELEDVAHGGIITDTEIKDNIDLLKILTENNYEIIKG